MSELETLPGYRENCIFCKIAQKIQPTEIVHEEEDFIVFNDYRPAAEFHILVIPKRHYGPLTTLNSSHVELIKKLKAIGNQLVEQRNINKSEVLEGFHWPIVSVNHLHLHLIAPKQQMNCFKRLEFNSYGFGSSALAIETISKI